MVLADFDYALVTAGGTKTCEPRPTRDEVIASAGPDGIYLFHSDGTLLAKYYLGRPVAGLTWGPANADGSNWLYFTSGPQIGALETRLKPRAPQTPPAPAQPSVATDASAQPSNGNLTPKGPAGNKTSSRPDPPTDPPRADKVKPPPRSPTPPSQSPSHTHTHTDADADADADDGRPFAWSSYLRRVVRVRSGRRHAGRCQRTRTRAHATAQVTG
jgi:hypothetical protein